MSHTRWQFWIDVGGTFTDCIARSPEGALVRHKLLSSGIVKGTVQAGSTTSEVAVDRHHEQDDFFRGYRFRLLDQAGELVAERLVTGFHRSRGVVQLDAPLPAVPAAGAPCELASDEEAPLVAIRFILGLRRDESIPSVAVRLGTTRGTNALLTRTGARTALITTRGFGDMLRIGYQNRPRLFDVVIRKPPSLAELTVEIDERMAADGEVLVAPDAPAVRAALERLKVAGIESLAICLLHGYLNPRHERLVERIAREVGFDEISRSSRVSPLIKLVARGDTTVADAYLNPVLRDYVARLRETIDPASSLRLLTSAGGLVDAGSYCGKDSILSGPAGGVVGFSRVARACGFDRAIGFDMGGTSTDVARFDGDYEFEFETEKAGVRIVAPMMAIETVAAGGGSVCWFDGVKLCVGPQSAGADPGPACYGRGGPLAVTDINLLLGKIPEDEFPFRPDRPAATARLHQLRDEINAATAAEYDSVQVADGFHRVANANMATAIRSISVNRGYDPSDYVLVAFGGAAPQHACAIAAELGIPRILNHPDAGILSAVGAGLADVARHRAVAVDQPASDTTLLAVSKTLAEIAAELTCEVENEGIPVERIEVVRTLDLRYRGVDSSLSVREPDDGDFARAFTAHHRRLYGYVHAGRELEVVAARVEVLGRSETQLPPSRPVSSEREPRPARWQTAYFGTAPFEAAVFHRAALQPGDRLRGPAIVVEPVSTTVIDPGWTAEVLGGGELLLERHGAEKHSAAQADSKTAPEATTTLAAAATTGPNPDPVQLEIFNNHFAGIAEQMGITLRNTSSSVNVKERLDFSCALFTARGDLVVNAPHIPVHLGAMSETVKRTLADHPDLQPGDVFAVNDPYRGGSHLPDITVVAPVHDDESGELRFVTASRAHHAELGGITPGSMPPFSKNLAEEGVLLRNLKIVAGGEARFDELRAQLLAGPYPTRAVADNLADISAQIAANRQGARDLQRLVERYGWPQVHAYMQHMQSAAERKLRAALARLPNGRRDFVDYLDDGSPICAAVTVRADAAMIDFSGTGPVLPGNLNANRAIVTAAVMYCLRLLIDEDIPLNQGVLAPIEIVLPTCLLNPPGSDDPADCPAVVGGNVETSQRIVDVLLGAFGLAAASQGTMNNVLFGDETFGYYETICGGSGAARDANGADAVHTHMTNTRLTDPEVLEQRYPVRLRSFSIRRGSGGAGRHRGGDGVTREIEFLRDVTVSILSQRRGAHPPYGVAGGRPGACGENLLLRRDGPTERLPGWTQFEACAGDTLIIHTPGGGGWQEEAGRSGRK